MAANQSSGIALPEMPVAAITVGEAEASRCVQVETVAETIPLAPARVSLIPVHLQAEFATMMARAKEAGTAMRESTIRGEILPSFAARGCGTYWQFR